MTARKADSKSEKISVEKRRQRQEEIEKENASKMQTEKMKVIENGR